MSRYRFGDQGDLLHIVVLMIMGVASWALFFWALLN